MQVALFGCRTRKVTVLVGNKKTNSKYLATLQKRALFKQGTMVARVSRSAAVTPDDLRTLIDMAIKTAQDAGQPDCVSRLRQAPGRHHFGSKDGFAQDRTTLRH